ncbi:pseudouridine synthase [Karstenula rhodostoma CBS 690.94]|uniref:tRNA pseudouridine(55) synthase n=1 Tax=Karstenula rhodostoma CBS 690.94 TaxID=1392251 RepID=A0A9P4U6C0_9PLEO|nr:pseudouridine synthase [Karstenula rhodostoma CBS 690.94]
MASPTKESQKVLEGIFAINKPQWASSAGVLRDLQTHFDKSTLFAPWITHTKRAMELSGSKKRHIQNLKVKLGHGGTLDPLATGVLIVGVGRGTKCLSRFLECTKSYECVVLFGAATDSYDAVGKIVSKGEYQHVTKELVEEKLAQFRGKIMQKPSVFSALKVDGKKMYEYARAGGDIPEVPARPVEVEKLELVEWLDSGSHEFAWPKEEIDGTEKVGAERLLGIRKKDADVAASRSKKRSRSPEDALVIGENSLSKKPREDGEHSMSGALPVETGSTEVSADAAPVKAIPTEGPADEAPAESTSANGTETGPAEDAQPPEPSPAQTSPPPNPPAVRLRMTVTSGFYVRSLCHDLGLACNSLGLMSSLIRTRQGDYELEKNVLNYSDLEAGIDTWEPKVQNHLEDFMEKEGWEAEEVLNEEEWKEKAKEQRRDSDRNRSYRGGGKNWRR